MKLKRPRIILADDHRLLLDTIRKLLEPEFDVVGTFSDGLSLVEGASKLDPDLIVLDIGMPLLNGLSAGQQLKQQLPKVKLFYLTMNLETDMAAEAFRIGASGYSVKNSAATELVDAIRLVLRGGRYLTPLLINNTDPSFFQKLKQKKSPDELTLRQKEVLQLLAEGYSMKEVAYKLHVTPRTVAFHKYSMMEHLRVHSTAELIQFALKHSIAGT
jgi:DNA-binding NarL/FixJ family response regulator